MTGTGTAHVQPVWSKRARKELTVVLEYQGTLREVLWL